MSAPPTVPERYSKRDNDFNGNIDGSAPGGTASGRMRIEDEGLFIGFWDVQDFQGDLVKALRNPTTGATDVLIDVAIPTRPVTSEAPDVAPVLTADEGLTTIALRWTDVPNAESFALGRSLVMGGPYTGIFEGLALGFDDGDVVAGTVYYYVVTPLNRFGAGPESNEALGELGGAAASLSGLRWELPCTGTVAGGCETLASASDAATMGGVGGTTYAVTLRLRGVAEEKSYPGGVPAADVWNVYSLQISSPASIAYMNQGTSGHTYCTEWDFEITVAIDAGATVTLLADSIDSLQSKNLDIGGTPIIIPGIPPDPLAYNGQFFQMDVIAIDGQAPGDDFSEIYYPPAEFRLEHASLDGLGWALGGHTAAGRRAAGFGGSLQAREYGLTRAAAPHAAVETDGAGLMPFGVMPLATLEPVVIAAELFGEDF